MPVIFLKDPIYFPSQLLRKWDRPQAGHLKIRDDGQADLLGAELVEERAVRGLGRHLRQKSPRLARLLKIMEHMEILIHHDEILVPQLIDGHLAAFV